MAADRDGTEVLAYGYETYSVAWWDGDGWRDIGDIGWGGFQDIEPTHWQPLPPPPSGITVHGKTLVTPEEMREDLEKP